MKNSIESTKRMCYPDNLLAAIIDTTKLDPLDSFSREQQAGLNYALFTLEDREQEVLRMRYEEGLTISEIAAEFSVSQGRVRQIESKALVRLRYPYRWNYIKMGITGYLQYKARSEYNRGYSDGHRAGYADGFEDGKRGVTREFGPDHILNQPLEHLNLSVRPHNCLVSKHCKTIGDVARLSEDQIRVIRNFGRKSAAEVAQKLKDIGITNSDWDIYLA